jgi:hypothetical protein
MRTRICLIQQRGAQPARFILPLTEPVTVSDPARGRRCWPDIMHVTGSGDLAPGMGNFTVNVHEVDDQG